MNQHTGDRSPFQPGDRVRYTPSTRGAQLEVNTPSDERLAPGRVYTVTAIIDRVYVVVDGYTHPGLGLYWSEFSPAE